MIPRISLVIFAYSFVFNCDFVEAYCPKAPDLNGIIAPVFTPYKCCTREPDLDKVDQMGKYYASKGITKILVTGKAGEGYQLSEAECKSIYDRWVAVGNRYGLLIYVLVGPPTPVGIRLAEYAESIGVQGIFILLPIFIQPTSTRAAVEDMRLIADKVKKTPVLLYIDPMSLPKCLRVDEVYYMASKKLCNFFGIRCGMELASQIRAAGLYKPDHSIVISNQYAIQATFCLGFNGSVSVANSLFPELALAIQNANCQAEGLYYQEKINKLIRCISESPSKYIASTKVASSIMSGINAGSVRPPIDPTTCEQRKRISRCLENTPGLDVRAPVRSCNECNYFYDSGRIDETGSQNCNCY